jgi:hypothetical protein
MSKKTQVIEFVANKSWLTKDSRYSPIASIHKNIPDWYRDGDRFYKDQNGEYFKDPVIGGRMPTWKACPAIYDTFTTGYVYRTPCDIEFSLFGGKVFAKVLDSRYDFFLQSRPSMPGFPTPYGYHEDHFAWFPDWACSVPEGYSVLYSQPFNRYDLPFVTTEGIIDNDKISLPGSMPFFIRKEWEGVIPAGTPFAQLLPFKREDWESKIVTNDSFSIFNDKKNNSIKYRIPDGGVYLKDIWERRKYS